MRLTPRTPLAAVATAVGDALTREGITAILTGGACASLYTRGLYQSVDIDFDVPGAARGTPTMMNSTPASHGTRTSLGKPVKDLP